MLYNLKSDLKQKKDLSQQYPEVLDRLKKMMIKMHKDVLSESPVWEIPAGAKRGKARIWDSY